MIARLELGRSGPCLTGVFRLAGAPRHRRAHRALVLVSRALYCESPEAEWRSIDGAASTIEARVGERRYTASASLPAIASAAGLRGTLVPEDALRNDSLLRSRPRAARRRGRWRRLRAARFRPPGRTRRNLARTAVIALVTLSGGALVFASVTASEARSMLDDARTANAVRSDRAAMLERLRDEEARLRVERAVSPRVKPGRLVSAIVASLAPEQRLRSLSVEGDDLTIVAEGDLALIARIDSLERVRVLSHTITERDGLSTVTIRSRGDSP